MIARYIKDNTLSFKLLDMPTRVTEVIASRININCYVIRKTRGINHSVIIIIFDFDTRFISIFLRRICQFCNETINVCLHIRLGSRINRNIITCTILMNVICCLLRIILFVNIRFCAVARGIYIRVNLCVACEFNLIIFPHIKWHCFGFSAIRS